MPKIDATHRVERIRKRIAQLERGDALEARDINALLTPLQQKQLKTAWAKQQHLHKLYKPPKTEDEKNKLGWKTIREVRLEVFKQALDDLLNNLVAEIEQIQHKSEVRAGRVFMDAFSDAHKNGKNTWSAGNIALRRNGFNRIDGQSYRYNNKRNREVNEMEDSLRESMEDDFSAEEKEQLELSRESDKALAKRRKRI
jgi:hypothetical protein